LGVLEVHLGACVPHQPPDRGGLPLAGCAEERERAVGEEGIEERLCAGHFADQVLEDREIVQPRREVQRVLQRLTVPGRKSRRGGRIRRRSEFALDCLLDQSQALQFDRDVQIGDRHPWATARASREANRPNMDPSGKTARSEAGNPEGFPLGLFLTRSTANPFTRTFNSVMAWFEMPTSGCFTRSIA
jgi:hypothetical protein